MGFKKYTIRLSQEQEKKLKERANAMGFSRKCDYLRFMIFIDFSFIEKINDIHNKICGDKNG